MNRRILAFLLGALCAACAQLTPEQRAEIELLRTQVAQAESGIRTHVAEIEQAKKDFAAGRLTQEQLAGLVLKSQEQVADLQKLGQAALVKARDLEKQGVPQWQTALETLWPTILGVVGAVVVAKQGDKKAVLDAVAKVTEIRGPIDARKGAPPKA